MATTHESLDGRSCKGTLILRLSRKYNEPSDCQDISFKEPTLWYVGKSRKRGEYNSGPALPLIRHAHPFLEFVTQFDGRGGYLYLFAEMPL